MSVGVMLHVAARAEGGEVAPAASAVGGIVVEMRGCEIDRPARHADVFERDEGGLRAQRPTATVTPGARPAIPPDAISVGELGGVQSVGSTTSFAASLGAHEADEVGDLGPVDWVELPMFGTDRHGAILNHPGPERKRKIAVAGPLGRECDRSESGVAGYKKGRGVKPLPRCQWISFVMIGDSAETSTPIAITEASEPINQFVAFCCATSSAAHP